MDPRLIRRLNWRIWREPIDEHTIAVCVQADRPSSRGGGTLCERACCFLIVERAGFNRVGWGEWQKQAGNRLIELCDKHNYGRLPYARRAAIDGPVASWLPEGAP